MDQQGQNGLMTTYREGWRSRGGFGVLLAVVMVSAYLGLYFTDVFDKPAQAIGLRNKWYLYGFTYCIAMMGGGAYYLKHHGNSRYNRIRIGVNIAVQICFGFTLPFVMPMFGQPEFYFSYFWPLKYNYFFPQDLQSLPTYLAVYTLLGSGVAAPVLAYFYGKRWYCSWVCGCGGLANTFGDPFRHLTSTSTKSWRFEQAAIHTVMFLAVAMTLMVGLDFVVGAENPTFHKVVSGPWWEGAHWAFSVKGMYGLVVGSILSGVIGTGLYPVLGPRVWCRNFCPMAAMLGWIQKLGRFQITVKKDMCISCGNCSTYCEMGIDVRSYAQNNESFTRAACVGCGMCAHVCPRGVLKLENVTKENADKSKTRLPIVNF